MKNVKDQVYAALCTVSENVSDAYPRSWAEGSTLQYTEEQNDVYEASSDAEGMREDKALVRYRIDIWNNHSTSEAALQVDEAMKVTGLKRIACADVPDPSGMKHKQMRYEGIIDMDAADKKEIWDFQEKTKDGTVTEFTAQFSVKRTGGGVNGVIEFEVTMAVQSEIKQTDPA